MILTGDEHPENRTIPLPVLLHPDTGQLPKVCRLPPIASVRCFDVGMRGCSVLFSRGLNTEEKVVFAAGISAFRRVIHSKESVNNTFEVMTW